MSIATTTNIITIMSIATTTGIMTISIAMDMATIITVDCMTLNILSEDI
jgi:hypothetical protein